MPQGFSLSLMETDPQEHLTCGSCNVSSIVEAGIQPYLILEPKGQLHECLEDFTRKKREGRRCSSCGSTHVCSQHLLHKAPKVLVIQLNRSFDDGSNRKNQTVVDVSSQSLELPTKCEGRLLVVPYLLKAVVCHHSNTISTGHYITYAKHGNMWFRFDDLSVRALSSNTVSDSLNTRHAYMYVFEKAA